MNEKRELLRHLVATVVFRGRIAIDGASTDFADYRATDDTRSPIEILAHIGDLLVGSRHLMQGEFIEIASEPRGWNDEVERFTVAARELDDFLAGESEMAYPVEKFVQGPIGDALTHVGQLVMLRRMAGIPVTPAPYFTAEIIPGEN